MPCEQLCCESILAAVSRIFNALNDLNSTLGGDTDPFAIAAGIETGLGGGVAPPFPPFPDPTTGDSTVAAFYASYQSRLAQFNAAAQSIVQTALAELSGLSSLDCPVECCVAAAQAIADATIEALNAVFAAASNPALTAPTTVPPPPPTTVPTTLSAAIALILANFSANLAAIVALGCPQDCGPVCKPVICKPVKQQSCKTQFDFKPCFKKVDKHDDGDKKKHQKCDCKKKAPASTSNSNGSRYY